jgi:hypothetical protein
MRSQPPTERGQKAVAVVVAECVVDFFESVEVDDGDRRRSPGAAAPPKLGCHPLMKEGSVWKIGQGIVLGQVFSGLHLPSQPSPDKGRNPEEDEIEDCQADDEVAIQKVQPSGYIVAYRCVREIDLQDAYTMRWATGLEWKVHLHRLRSDLPCIHAVGIEAG